MQPRPRSRRIIETYDNPRAAQSFVLLDATPADNDQVYNFLTSDEDGTPCRFSIIVSQGLIKSLPMTKRLPAEVLSEAIDYVARNENARQMIVIDLEFNTLGAQPKAAALQDSPQ